MASLTRTVQLRTPESVIQAYENWNTPHFAIVNNKQLIFAYDNDPGDIGEGGQLLQQWVTILCSSGSAGIYTLCIYKDLKGKCIASNTPYNGSVNFQFHEYKYPALPGAGGAADASTKLLLDRIEALQLQITKLQEESDDEPDTGDNMISGIASLLNNPVVAGLLGALIPKPGTVQRLPGASMEPVAEPGKVSRIAGVATPDQDQLLADSLAKLKAAVPELPAVLAQLAKLQEKKPFQFKLYMATLMAMKF